MITKIQYTDSETRQAILDNNKDKILIEEDNVAEGNFLIFSDIKPVEQQLAELKNQNLILMDALATIFETISGGA